MRRCKVTHGFVALKESAFTAPADRPIENFRTPPADKSKIAQIVYGGFARCLYATQKFQSDAERRLAVILDREADKWFKPAGGQFQIYYLDGHDHKEYVPDFVAETASQIYLIEVKAENEMDDATVLAKKKAAETWCRHASDHTLANGVKPWGYAVIAHSMIADNMTLERLLLG